MFWFVFAKGFFLFTGDDIISGRSGVKSESRGVMDVYARRASHNNWFQASLGPEMPITRSSPDRRDLATAVGTSVWCVDQYLGLWAEGLASGGLKPTVAVVSGSLFAIGFNIRVS